jgi:hypothetical protein
VIVDKKLLAITIFMWCWITATVVIGITKPWLCAAFAGMVPLINHIRHRIEFADVYRELFKK